MLMPPYDTAATLLALQAVIARYEPRIVVSLGDSFHDDWGSERLPGVFRERLLALMAGRDWFWIAGNHDPKPPVDLPGTTVQGLAVGAVRFRHEPSRGAEPGEVAGHLHPCARIVQRAKSVRRRCFATDGSRMIAAGLRRLYGFAEHSGSRLRRTVQPGTADGAYAWRQWDFSNRTRDAAARVTFNPGGTSAVRANQSASLPRRRQCRRKSHGRAKRGGISIVQNRI
jgi:DNA ligase-associated metallophosphoesterase